ncbi:MAG TPA: hypothetical protein VMH24_01470, partial [Candidatus Sulfotelmatobacter sp.]|nr:hypothetical protein [Candidatus Sulfotelmatobacter sp.]
MREAAPLYPPHRQQLERLSDAVGTMQHADGRDPAPRHGYCTDDVARALQVDLLHARALGWSAVAPSAWRALAFLRDAIPSGGTAFRNFRAAGGAAPWLDERGSDDCQGRAMLALGDATANALDVGFRREAAELLLRVIRTADELTALRGRASALLGCAAAGPLMGGEVLAARDRLADRIGAAFEASDSGWWWPEPVLTYEGGLPIRALCCAAEVRRRIEWQELAVTALDAMLAGLARGDGGLDLVGNDGWWPRDGRPVTFDQQPVDATALLLAAEAALRATGSARFLGVMEQAYAWFLGANALGTPVAEPWRGGCHDGLRVDGVNPNEGAESTISWL